MGAQGLHKQRDVIKFWILIFLRDKSRNKKYLPFSSNLVSRIDKKFNASREIPIFEIGSVVLENFRMTPARLGSYEESFILF